MAHVKLDLTDAARGGVRPPRDLDVFARWLPDVLPGRASPSCYPDAVCGAPAAAADRHDDAGQHRGRRRGARPSTHRLVSGGLGPPRGDAVRAYRGRDHGCSGWDELAADLARRWTRVLPTFIADRITLAARRQLDRVARWFLTQPALSRWRSAPRSPGSGRGSSNLAPRVPDLLRGGEAQGLFRRTQDFVIAGTPVDLAQRALGGLYAFGLLDVVEIAEIAEREHGGVHTHDGEVTDDEVLAVADLYYALSEHLGLDRLDNGRRRPRPVRPLGTPSRASPCATSCTPRCAPSPWTCWRTRGRRSPPTRRSSTGSRPTPPA